MVNQCWREGAKGPVLLREAQPDTVLFLVA